MSAAIEPRQALDSHVYEWDGATHTAPRWELFEQEQRDYAAEAAGY